MDSNNQGIKTFRYRPFAGGGVAEFLAAHGVVLKELSSCDLRCLQFSLAQKLSHAADEDFYLDTGDSSLIFEGPDEMGHLYHHVNAALRCAHADF